ncbi:MAG: undecaprenyldiphospho-muramoylpentapeptide beta-N-acetylglucosaminyltransferase [Saprospiraceae bacterium]|nr:undecaprenyldiphospho-muramoylpentapeptide beta-N-acetylglucosaminyltransferase [Saprospiraceae bacterium]
MRVLISGGGTGGHVFPAIAIGRALQQLDPAIELLFVGAEGRLEMSKVPEAGFEIIGLPIRGMPRRLGWPLITWPFALLKSGMEAIRILRRFRPNAVVGVGGYASGPTLAMACCFGIPIVVQEQNAYPGMTNRILGRCARKICVAFEGMGKYFNAGKLVVTGNPVRQTLATLPSRQEALRFFDLDPSKRTVCVFGGSLGARSINRAMTQNLGDIAADQSIQWLWQSGGVYERELADAAPSLPAHVRRYPFVERMDMAYAAADVVVSRAGALTLAEIALVAKPCILVPSPNVAGDHQRINAMQFERSGAALCIEDPALPVQLLPAVRKQLENVQSIELQVIRLKELARPDASQDIARTIIQMTNA